MRSIGVVGVPTNSSGRLAGVAAGPAALRDAGVIEALLRDMDVRDYGDVRLPKPSPSRDPRTQLIDPDGLSRLVPACRDAVRDIVDDGRFPLVIGGDCPILVGCIVAARADGSVGLLFVDGHEDAYVPDQSPTGEAADMELAFALGIADASWSPELSSVLPVVAEADVRILGVRDAETLRAEGVSSLADRVFLADADTLVRDPEGITDRACSSLADPWWFHLDLDVLSTEAMPAVDYPQPGGLDWDALSTVATTALQHDPTGWDVTIYNPDLDADRRHAARIVEFLVDVLRRA